MHDDGFYIKEILDGKTEEAIFSLVRKYEKKVFNLCFRIIKSRELAEEVAQDAFLKSFRELRKLEDFSKYEIWLSRIAYHLSIDVTRKKKRYYTDIDQVNPVEMRLVSTTSLDQMDRKLAIEQILQEIPSEDSALITLFYLNEMQVREVAEIMKISESNVKVKLLRIRKVLKERLNRTFKDEVYELF
ncbi:MAG: sigma-70 family RNA polymerase sigma factor [Bacteroidota bacterium]